MPWGTSEYVIRCSAADCPRRRKPSTHGRHRYGSRGSRPDVSRDHSRYVPEVERIRRVHAREVRQPSRLLRTTAPAGIASEDAARSLARDRSGAARTPETSGPHRCSRMRRPRGIHVFHGRGLTCAAPEQGSGAGRSAASGVASVGRPRPASGASGCSTTRRIPLR